MRAKARVEIGSGNVFADLGLPNPEELLVKAQLLHKIMVIIDQRGLTQVQAATLLRVDQPKVSALMRGRLSGFSLERLIRFLMLLGRDVRITVEGRRSGRKQPRLRVA